MMIKYTICFIRQADRILMLNREYPSWMGNWNGVGGKIEEGETPEQCIIREIYEETGIKLDKVLYKGLVTWSSNQYSGGMYAFIGEVKDDLGYATPRKTEEGILDWKDINWILDPQNTGVVSNIPHFLPAMLEKDEIYEHHCYYTDNTLDKVTSTIMP